MSSAQHSQHQQRQEHGDYDHDQFEHDEVIEQTTTTTRRHEEASVPQQHSTAGAPLHVVSIRETEEYRAAWDVEVWKALQVRQFQAEFKDTKRKETEAFRKALDVKEKEALAKVDRQARELTTRERRIVEEEKLLERRRQKLIESEREVKALHQKLEEHRRALDAEAELRVQRVKEDMAHRLELFQQKLSQSDDNTRRTEERLHGSQSEYMKLFEEFSHFKTQQLANPDVHAAAQVERLRTDHNLEMASLQDRLDRRHQEQVMTLTHRCQQLDAQVTNLSTALASKKQTARARAVELTRLATAAEHAERTIEELRRDKQSLEGQLLVSAQRVEALFHSKTTSSAPAAPSPQLSPTAAPPPPTSEIAALRQSIAVTFPAQSSSSGSKHHSEHPHSRRGEQNRHREHHLSFSDAQVALRNEIRRLEREKALLLDETGGAYSLSSPLVRSIDAKIAELGRQCVLPMSSTTEPVGRR